MSHLDGFSVTVTYDIVHSSVVTVLGCHDYQTGEIILDKCVELLQKGVTLLLCDTTIMLAHLQRNS